MVNRNWMSSAAFFGARAPASFTSTVGNRMT